MKDEGDDKRDDVNGNDMNEDEEDYEHRHKRRRTNSCTKENKEEAHFGIRANKSAKERAEELQKEVNDQRRKDTIEAHQRTIKI
eukprot:430661-Heterocapsa_arctica.AAC.1